MKKIVMLLAALLLTVITGCGGGGGDSAPVSLSSTKAITGFSLNDCFGMIDEAGKTIAVTMPPGTDVKTLVATFYTTGASVKVGSIVQTSGSITNNFSTTKQVTYTVTAADAMTQDYTVTITVSSLFSGFLDTGFGATGTGGKVTTAIGSSDDVAHALGIQSDGSIVGAGSSYNGSNYDFALVRYTKDGILDTGFGATGTGGKVTTAIGSGDAAAYALVIQSDDTILVAGYFYNSTNSSFYFALVKYTKDGIPDTGFGAAGTGIVTTLIGSSGDYTYSALGVQSDGSIVVAGSSYDSINSKYNFALVRYTKYGILDTTFGTNGIVTTPIGSGYDYANALVIQSDDTILVAGRSSYNSFNSEYNFALVRYTKYGILDTTFGTNGIVTTPIGSGSIIDARANALGVQSDGSIVAAGSSYDSTSSKYSFSLVRYTKDGILDTGFGAAGTGIVTTSIGIGGYYDFAYALVIQSDDSIVVAGSSNNGGNYDFALVKYTKDGSIDTTFGTNGIATTPIGSSDDVAHALDIQPVGTSDFKIVAAGSSYIGGNYDFSLVRYLP
jgi:uncharacterized delta-60 repeat protein